MKDTDMDFERYHQLFWVPLCAKEEPERESLIFQQDTSPIQPTHWLIFSKDYQKYRSFTGILKLYSPVDFILITFTRIDTGILHIFFMHFSEIYLNFSQEI